MEMITVSDDLVDGMSEEELRDFTKRLLVSLELAEDDGVFGTESWHGFLEIEV